MRLRGQPTARPPLPPHHVREGVAAGPHATPKSPLGIRPKRRRPTKGLYAADTTGNVPAMLAPTPPMGWNSWNTFGGEISDEIVLETARALLDTGLAQAGYDHVVIDDLWQLAERDANGDVAADPHKFPRGIAPLAAEIHALGLKFGIYSCAGTHTCARVAGSFGHEERDARTFADWGVDLLKYDYCNVPFGADGPALYRRMGRALRATGRDILFSACEWGMHEPWRWGRSAGCHLWRATGDIAEYAGRVLEIAYGLPDEVHAYAGPNGWTDLDMLVVGMGGQGNVAGERLTPGEERLHFGHWCMARSPLFIGADVRSLPEESLRLLLSPGLVGLSQDSMGAPGRRLRPVPEAWDWKDYPVFTSPLADGGVAVELANISETKACESISVAWPALGLPPGARCRAVDLVTGDELGEFTDAFSIRVPRHDAAFVKLTPV